MKLSLFMNVLLISTLSVLAVGCGKDSKKKNNNNDYYYNPYLSGGSVVQGEQAVNSLNTWMGATETRPTPFGLPAVSLLYAVRVGDGCSEKSFLGLKFNICSSFGNNNITYPPAEIVTVPANLMRSAYPKMAAIMNPVAPTYLVGVYQYGQYFDVYHAVQGSQKLVRYTIDTNLHAGLNPREVEDSNTETKKTLTNY